MAQKACKPTTNGNGALQNIFNKCLESRVSTLETSGGTYDYVPVTGTSATISFINIARQIIGCQNSAETTLTFPEAGTSGKMVITIKDEALDASAGDLIFNRSGSDLIEGETQLRIIRSGSQKGISLTLYNDDSSNWYLI